MPNIRTTRIRSQSVGKKRNQMSKRLTIMVSLYNSGEWIENRLENLLAAINRQTDEIWCLNANSPDERDDLIPQKFPVKYIKLDTRVGVYAAWNHIIRESTSEFITNANADDLVSPQCYDKLSSVLATSEMLGFAYPSWCTTDIPNQKWDQLGMITREGGEPGNYRGDIERAGVGHFPMWRRSLHQRYGFFDEEFRVLGDADWWARCYYLGEVKFFWLNEVLACYLWRSGQNLWHREITADEWARYHGRVQRYMAGQS